MRNTHGKNLTLPYQILRENRAEISKSYWQLAKSLITSTFLFFVLPILCQAQGTITGFNLINAISSQTIQPLTSGAVVNLATLPNQKVNIQAVTNPSTVGSVSFNLSGQQTKTRMDNIAPYSLFGDDGGDYFSWIPTVGNYTLTVRSFSGANGSGTAGTLVTITFSVVNQTAPLPLQYTLSVVTTGSGSASQNPNQATYSNGSNVTLTATPDLGFVFSGWGGDASGTTNPLTISMTSNKNVTATFTASPQQFNLGLSTSGKGTVSQNPVSASYAINSIVNITATPDSGYAFSGWSGDASGKTNPLAVTMNSDKNITATFTTFSPAGYCGPNNSDGIGCFKSVKPVGQTPVITYPNATHRFQMIAKEATTSYTDGTSGKLPGAFDYAGFVPANGSSKKGYLCLNHEKVPGRVSILNLTLNDTTLLWSVDAVRNVSFSSVVKTESNCAGAVTPWGTIITSEETATTGDSNKNDYQDVGWHVEIDPATGLIPDYDNNGSRDKLWALGRMNHENLAITPDGVTAYQTEDGGTKCVYKFVADQAGNLSAGKLYVLRRDATNPTIGQWIQVPNTTKTKRNNISKDAATLGGTKWVDGLEEIEIGKDGKVYFGTPANGTIMRFKDDGATVSEIEAWVTRQSYPITYDGGVQKEDWGVGVDNLAFDGDGNLWVMQDKGRANLWVVRPDHTPSNPKVELFLTSPDDSEPTGLTFTPDSRYGFLSFQGSNSAATRTILDAAGKAVKFDQDVLIVFANKKYLGPQTSSKLAQIDPAPSLEVAPNPFSNSTNIKVDLQAKAHVKLEVYNMYTGIGQAKTLFDGDMETGSHTFEFIPPKEFDRLTGVYLVRLQVNNKQYSTKILHLRE